MSSLLLATHFLLISRPNVCSMFARSQQIVLATLIKKKDKIFLIYNEIQIGLVAKSNIRKGFLIYEEMRKYLTIYEEAVSHK
jgi:hypothetical protein